MSKVNPAREFLRRVEALVKAENRLTTTKWDEKKKEHHHRGPDGRNYWPFGINHECLEKDCFKRKDGLWEQRKMINTHMKDGGEVCAFIWRLHPNYCCDGQPCISNKNQEEFYEKSETEKILYETNDLEFVWRWIEVLTPNRNRWGSTMGRTFFEIRRKEDKEPIVQSITKAGFIREYNSL